MSTTLQICLLCAGAFIFWLGFMSGRGYEISKKDKRKSNAICLKKATE